NLYEKIYIAPSLCGQAVLINARPQLEGVQGWNTHPEYKYDNKDLWTIWTELLQADLEDNSYYDFDVVNLGRQVLGNLFSDYRAQFTACYKRKDLQGARAWAKRMDELILDVDRLLACSPLFSIGKWIQDARDCGTTEEEKNYYEENARCILTIWGQKDTQLNDYA
ncbi:Alpha-N-acetylglucosaminidase, partial [gut metagenome]